MRRFVLLVILLLIVVSPTAAHGYIVRSIPEDRSSLERAPTRLQYWFSEALEPQFSQIHLRNQDGEIIASGGVDEQDNSLLTLRVPNLDDGAYIVELRPAFASDGHVIVDNSVFFVGDTVLALEVSAAENPALPLEILWKTLLFGSTYLMFGAAVLYVYVFVPVWGSTKYPAGLLPPRLMTALNIIIYGGLMFAIWANILGLMQQTMIFFGQDLDQVLSGNLWNVVRIGTRFGDVWHFRMAALLLILILQTLGLYFRKDYPRVVRSFWTANTWLLALLIGGQAVNSHAAGSLVGAWTATIVHWIHTLSVAFWIGGIAALVMLLPTALRPYAGEARWQALRPVMQRFSRYMMGVVLLVIATGIYSASNWFFTPADVATGYGGALGLKLLMVGLLFFVGALHHLALRPDMLESLQPLAKRVQSFAGSMRLELVFALLALGSAAFLSATPIPEPEFLQDETTTPRANQIVNGYELQLTIAPGGTGINTMDFVLRQGEELVNDATVEVQFVAPDRDVRSRWLHAEFSDNGLYVLVNDAFDKVGRWWVLVDVNAETRFAVELDISTDANVIVTLPPSVFTISAGLLTIAAILYFLYPLGRRLAQTMDWTPTNVVISVGAIIMTIGAIWVSLTVIDQQQVAIEQQRNPPPQRVNPLLPTNDLLATSEGLYREHCIHWQNKTDFATLIAELDFIRDEELFTITQFGWRNIAACTGELGDTERWQIVNYVRTLRHIQASSE